ncbi:uncharacterized protein PHACADRAFT_191841 [Phanerochaete carnosa HHB-10118-sp]|uniref:Uncharacterized protein n=1 Tax=Phanerochaete carnosa (strain HHB-10118-sp) TaxID=650164 RepID=K5X9B3_PHACS|nr:uncharacterized protein PHACADRAFT_191841 [Phanerochaete carnosa HHB-10118-sp]EKM59477.1 hypothetical protein PHACADRAFT_191841 [Phanerochaete carnosa HHB-10118-sp]
MNNSFYAGYARADILKKPNLLTSTVTLPARPSAKSSTPDDSLQTPYPTAYRCVKAFLKVLLKAEVELEPKESRKSLIIELGAQRVVEELRRQLLAYSSAKPPALGGRLGLEGPSWA